MGDVRAGRAIALSAVSISLLALAVSLGGCGWFRPPAAPLEPPQQVTASQGAHPDRVEVGWSQVAGAGVYEVHRADDEDGDYEKLRETSATAYSDSDVVRGEVYWYKVRACRAGECGEFAQPVEGYPEIAAGPTGLAASYDLHPDLIELGWDPLDGADEYQIEVRDEAGDKVGAIRRVDGATPTFVHRYVHQAPVGEPKPGHEYTYRVRATGEGFGTTAWSDPAQGRRHGRPAAPVLAEDPEVSVDTVVVGNDDEEEEQDVWTVTLEWTWIWEPASNPNPALEFHIFRRDVDAGTAYTLHTIYDGPGEDGYDPQKLPYEPDNGEPIAETYTFLWDDDEDLEEGGTYRYDVRAFQNEWFVRSAPVEVVIEES